MPSSRVKLPAGVRSPFEVYVNGGRQALGGDYSVSSVELVEQRLGDGRAAHPRDRLDLADVGDRHDAGQDRHLDPDRARLLDEPEIQLVVEEQLCDQEGGAGLDLLLEEPQIVREVGGL